MNAAEADRLFWLLRDRQLFTTVGVSSPHAARIDGALRRAERALVELLKAAAPSTIESMAVDRAVASGSGGVDGITPEILIEAMDQLTAEFGELMADLKHEELRERLTIESIRDRRAPLRNAVLNHIAQLEAKRAEAIRARDTLGFRKSPSAIQADLVAAGVPADLVAAVTKATGAPIDMDAEFTALNMTIHTLSMRILKLQEFSCATPGDYTAIEGEQDLAELVESERSAREEQ